MKHNNRPSVSYFSLMSRFWALDELINFSPVATKLYFLLLHTANKNRWPSRFPFADTRAAVAVGVSAARIKTARKQLEDAGLIMVIPGGNGHAQKTMYKLTACDHCEMSHNPSACIDECHQNAVNVGSKNDVPTKTPNQDLKNEGEHEALEKGHEVGCKNDIPNPSSLLIRHIKDKDNLSSSGSENLDFDEIKVPQDGEKRNLTGLKDRLKELAASPADAKKIIIASDFGKIGHPVWGALSEIRNSKPGSITAPVRFILSRINHANSIRP